MHSARNPLSANFGNMTFSVDERRYILGKTNKKPDLHFEDYKEKSKRLFGGRNSKRPRR